MRFASLVAQKRYAALVIAGCLVTMPFHGARAEEPASFVIPASDQDGYGIGECLHQGSACGRVIADAWCEAHGHAKALAFGSASDTTGTLPGAVAATRISADDVLIRCGE